MFFPAKVKSQHDPEGDQVSRGFIQLHRVLRDIIYPRKDEAPGDIRGPAQDFGIEDIAQPDQSPGQGCWHCHAVQHPHQWLVRVFASVNPERDKDSDCTAVAGQAAFPDGGDQPWVGEVIPRLVEEDMSQARADYGAEEQVDQAGVQVRFVLAFHAVHPLHDEEAYEEPRRHEQTVPAERDGADPQEFGACVPIDITQ